MMFRSEGFDDDQHQDRQQIDADSQEHGLAVFMIKAGAALITSAEDIFDAFGLPREKENLKLNLALEPNEEKIYSLLAEPTGRDELIRKTGLPPAKANSVISMMLLNGLIKESGGEIFRA